MRTILVTLLVLITSCKSVYYMGMSEGEFKRKNTGERAVYMKDNVTVYKIDPLEGSALFYYFKNGVLVKVDEGQRNPDVVVEVK